MFLIDAPTILWVGNTDLTVEFEVTDVESGAPIQGADISILSEGGFNADGDRLRQAGLRREELKLTTDDTGVARYLCRDSMCCGEQSTLRFTDTLSVYLPRWRVTVGAVGYTAHEPFILEERPNRRKEQRDGPRRAKLVVPIKLSKSP